MSIRCGQGGVAHDRAVRARGTGSHLGQIANVHVGGAEARTHRVCGGLGEQGLRASLDGADPVDDERTPVEFEDPGCRVDDTQVETFVDVAVDFALRVTPDLARPLFGCAEVRVGRRMPGQPRENDESARHECGAAGLPGLRAAVDLTREAGEVLATVTVVDVRGGIRSSRRAPTATSC